MSKSAAPIVVQKYGGSSLADADKVTRIARKVKARVDENTRVVVVVSAMGDTTNDFINLARRVTQSSSDLGYNGAREMDRLMSAGELVSSSIMSLALQSLGVDATSLSGAQSGINTNATHMSARIADINTARLQKELGRGRTVVVAGFQGLGSDGEVTTLGRGGSDTTAVALAIALEAKQCEIYTDVAGIYTADPRVCADATLIKRIRAEEMLEMANLGAKMNPRSIELAARYKIPVYVSDSFGDELGTLIYSGGKEMETRNPITGIAIDAKIGKIVITDVIDRPGIAAGLLKPLADEGIGVSAIVQNTSADRTKTNFTFIVAADDTARARKLIESQKEVVFERALTGDDLVKISIVGTGVTNSPEYAAKMFQTLAGAGVNIDMIMTSEISISCVISSAKKTLAVQALHDAFELDNSAA